MLKNIQIFIVASFILIPAAAWADCSGKLFLSLLIFPNHYTSQAFNVLEEAYNVCEGGPKVNEAGKKYLEKILKAARRKISQSLSAREVACFINEADNNKKLCPEGHAGEYLDGWKGIRNFVLENF